MTSWWLDRTDRADAGPDHLLWYVAYGSNLSADRMACYLGGGVPAGGRRRYPGCRDPRAPRRTEPVSLPGGVYFALESAVWTGGLALYDPAASGPTAARGYLVTAEQLSDVIAQEMHRAPGTGPSTELLRRAGTAGAGPVRLGPGHYETLVYAGTRDGHPMLTFTAPWRAGDVEVNPPAPAYLAMMARGLHEAHGFDDRRIVDHLAGLPGIRGRWPPAALAAVVRAAVGGAVRP